MKDFRENDFDRLFKEKSQSFDFDFEEEAWNLMEKKLRKRDRFVLFRNTGAAILLFLICGTSLYLFRGSEAEILVKKGTASESDLSIYGKNKSIREESSDQADKEKEREKAADLKDFKSIHPDLQTAGKVIVKRAKQENFPVEEQYTIKNLNAARYDKPVLESLPYLLPEVEEERLSGNIELPSVTDSLSLSDKEKQAFNRPVYSFTFSAGPDFSAIRSIAGSQGSLNLGLLLNASIKRFTLSTGFRYGIKNYEAETYDYQLKNPSRASLISGIDASCNVLEIPLQLSFALSPRLSLSGGLSSYLMLKEKYRFVYTPESGIKDYLLQKNNENQSFFGMTGFSASYKFKPLKNGIQMGVEPYVKLPLGGVGEGKVKLKSSGITLNMTYDISRKH